MVEETSQVTTDSSIDKPSSVERVQKQGFWDRLGMGLSSGLRNTLFLGPSFCLSNTIMACLRACT